MVEHFAFQHFELLDQTDYRSYIKKNLDMVERNFQWSQSPYRVLRDKSKKSLIHKDVFVRYILKEIHIQQKEIVLTKGPIEIID